MHLSTLAVEHPDKPAVIMADGSRTVTFADLDRRRRTGKLLRRRLRAERQQAAWLAGTGLAIAIPGRVHLRPRLGEALAGDPA